MHTTCESGEKLVSTPRSAAYTKLPRTSLCLGFVLNALGYVLALFERCYVVRAATA